MMIVPILTLLLATGGVPGQKGPADGCTRFLTGDWAGKGTVKDFGPAIQVENVASYSGQGTYATRSRYRGADEKWTEQRLAGTWSATNGPKRGFCKLVMKSGGRDFGGSSTSDIQVINADTFRSLGFDMHRVRPGARPKG